MKAVNQLIGKESEHTFISLVTFTKRCTLKIGDDIRHISSDEMVIYDIHLSETIHRKTSTAKLQNDAPLYSDQEIENIYKTISAANITDSAKRQKHNRRIKSAIKDQRQNMEIQGEVSECVICSKIVSNNVKNYCLHNKQRFNGKIYCYEHQRSV